MPDAGDTLDYASAFSPGDARTLLFPVRAVRGVFAYVTSFDVLERFNRDTKAQITLPQADDGVQALVASTDALLSGTHVLLEDFNLTARHDQAVTRCAEWLATNALPDKPEYDYWRSHLLKHLIVLRIEEFRDFALYSTEVVTRIAIDRATKTVNKEKGALFTQELLPADTLLYSPVKVTNARDESGWKADKVAQELMKLSGQTQIGGDETVGRGRVYLRWNGA
jgi:CRISPR-associated protein Cmr4